MKNKISREAKKINRNRGEMNLGVEILIFLLIIFIIWVISGGPKKQTDEKPFITPLNDAANPGMEFGPNDSVN